MQRNHSFPHASPALSLVPIRTSRAMQRSFTLTLLLLLAAGLLCSTAARAEDTLTTAPAVTITPTVGPPTTQVLVSGFGFDPYATVDIYFDITHLAQTTTNAAGAFGGGGSFQGGIPCAGAGFRDSRKPLDHGAGALRAEVGAEILPGTDGLGAVSLWARPPGLEPLRECSKRGQRGRPRPALELPDRWHSRFFAGGGYWHGVCRLRGQEPIRPERQYGHAAMAIHDRGGGR